VQALEATGRSTSSVRTDANNWLLLDLTKHPCPLPMTFGFNPKCFSSGKVFGNDHSLGHHRGCSASPAVAGETFPHFIRSMKACEGGHILAAIQLLDCQRCQDSAEKQAEPGLARMSRVDKCNRNLGFVNPVASILRGWFSFEGRIGNSRVALGPRTIIWAKLCGANPSAECSYTTCFIGIFDIYVVATTSITILTGPRRFRIAAHT